MVALIRYNQKKKKPYMSASVPLPSTIDVTNRDIVSDYCSDYVQTYLGGYVRLYVKEVINTK